VGSEKKERGKGQVDLAKPWWTRSLHAGSFSVQGVSTLSRHSYVTQQRAADHVGVTPRTIRNWISEGHITGYRLPGARAIRIDLDELEAKMRVMPAVIRPKPQPFGPKAKIVTVVDALPPRQDQDQDHQDQDQDPAT
jgi:excisionase family DNA binding protein